MLYNFVHLNVEDFYLALCYSAAEYCAPVWSRSAHKSGHLERGELNKSVVIVLRDLADRQRMTN